MSKIKNMRKTKRQTIIYKILHRKLNIDSLLHRKLNIDSLFFSFPSITDDNFNDNVRG